MPGDSIEHPRQPLQGGQALPTVGVPHEELPALSLPLATTTGGQPPPVGTPDHAPDGPVMSREPQELRALGDLPHRDVAIFPTADQARAIRAPGHAQDPGRVRLSDPLVGRVPSGPQSRSKRLAVSPCMPRTHSPRSTSHSRSVPSSLPLSRWRLSGVKASPFTAAACPCSTVEEIPAFPCHSRIVWS